VLTTPFGPAAVGTIFTTVPLDPIYTMQCWGSVTFWCGSGSPDQYLLLMDPDPTPFFSDFKDAKIIFYIFL
jgi:hypothetical protein